MTTPAKPCKPWCGDSEVTEEQYMVAWAFYSKDKTSFFCSPTCRQLVRKPVAAPAPEAKPTRVEVGQIWSEAGLSGPYTVVQVDGQRAKLRFADGGGDSSWYPFDEILPYTFLGYAKPTATEAIPSLPPCSVCGGTTGCRCLAVAAPPRPIRREVSANGRDWCDIASLTDADAFESYPWRRIRHADGFSANFRARAGEQGAVMYADGALWMVISPAPTPDPGRAETQGDLAGAAAAALVTRPGT